MADISPLRSGENYILTGTPRNMPKTVKDDLPLNLPPSDQLSLGTIDEPTLIHRVHHEPSGSSRINQGFDENFVDENTQISLPVLKGEAAANALEIKGQGDHVRKYTHFSIVMHKERKVAIYTACNVDGNSMRYDVKRAKWKIDDVVGQNNQLGPEIYGGNLLDKGHMVRRLDVVWGSKQEAVRANEDTFYYTNAVPQHGNLNQKKWLDLENWLLTNADDKDQKLSVFTGPVLRDSDITYRGEQIPEDFYKIIVLKKRDGQVAAAAFMMSQKEFIQNLGKKDKINGDDGSGDKEVDTSEIAPYQVPVSKIEELTSLSFGNIKDIDAYSLYKSTKTSEGYSYGKNGQLLAIEPEPDIPRYINCKEDIII